MALTDEEKLASKNIIFVDCFDTVIFRDRSPEEVLKKWIARLAEIFDFDFETGYKIFSKVRFNQTVKLIFTRFAFEPKMKIIINLFFVRLKKIHPEIDRVSFLTVAFDEYLATEAASFSFNKELIEKLVKLKVRNAKIYMVSDFYCDSAVLMGWLELLKIDDVFDEIFVSCEYDRDKATGRLYRSIIKRLEADRKQILMIGDNGWSDIFMAKLSGLSTMAVHK